MTLQGSDDSGKSYYITFHSHSRLPGWYLVAQYVPDSRLIEVVEFWDDAHHGNPPWEIKWAHKRDVVPGWVEPPIVRPKYARKLKSDDVWCNRLPTVPGAKVVMRSNCPVTHHPAVDPYAWYGGATTEGVHCPDIDIDRAIYAYEHEDFASDAMREHFRWAYDGRPERRERPRGWPNRPVLRYEGFHPWKIGF